MGYVDLGDRMASTYTFARRTRKWTKKLFFSLIDIAVLNAFLLLKACQTSSKFSLKEFRMNLITSLIGKINHKNVEPSVTKKTGFCGIPPALVQRYAEELQHSIVDVADALDQIRITSLQQQGRRGVPNDFLSDSCIVPVIEPNYSSLQSWLTSLGLPMYLSNFESCGVTELHHVATLNEEDLAHLGVRNPYHQVYLESAIGALFMRYRRRPQTYPQGPSIA
ncbi:SAM and SH3 domain-containing protein 1 [Trichonephila clavata]|uniref:SAM and SH3 domain-containing protein 1 n=1 Tax=Trichonephila clavata TaxID=2740835 RepID=A0A8X6H8L4_TRICU|nr:SAM and SH3 domain-containing protein 1 [Trichonephila clavata]